MSTRAKYGVDGFPYLVGLLSGGALLVAAGTAVVRLTSGQVPRWVGGAVAVVGVAALVPGLLGLRYVLVGKTRHRDRMLDLVAWEGKETVLDVGTGAGLLALGAAKRVPGGRVIACDIWSAKDLSGNGIERTRLNAEIEGVAGRVDIRTEDARRLSLADGSVDVVVSTLRFHNIPDEPGRKVAPEEVSRVLRSGGCAVISDLAGVDRYAEWLEAAGCRSVQVSKAAGTFPPHRVLLAMRE